LPAKGNSTGGGLMSDVATTILALQRNWDMVTSAVEGVDDETLGRMPNDASNSMAWLVWHMTRVADRFIYGRFQDADQLWTAGGWEEKFGMDAGPDEFGMGWSTEQVANWDVPSRDVLVGYYDAVNTATRDYINGLDGDGLERQVPAAAPGTTMSVADALGILVWDNIVHGGQVAYIRGYFGGTGWHR
jgi:hypothetical protein